MKFLSICLGHSVAVTGFRLGTSVSWSNKSVLYPATQFNSFELLNGYFWLSYFYVLFSMRRNNLLHELWSEHMGVLIEDVQVFKLFNKYTFRLNLYIELFNVFFKKSFRASSVFPRWSSDSYEKTYNKRQYPSFESDDTYLTVRFIPYRFDLRKSFATNLVYQAEHQIREKSYLAERVGAFHTRYNYICDEELNLSFQELRQNLYSVFLFVNSYKQANFLRLYNQDFFNYSHTATRLVTGLLRRVENFFFYYFMQRQIKNFVHTVLQRHVMSVLPLKQFQIELVTSHSFVYPNVTAQFIIINLRRWYRIGEIFGRLRRLFSRCRLLKGLVVHARGRLTKRQRATQHHFRIGSTPYSTKTTPLFFFHKVYPLKYGASSISVCFYLSNLNNFSSRKSLESFSNRMQKDFKLNQLFARVQEEDRKLKLLKDKILGSPSKGKPDIIKSKTVQRFERKLKPYRSDNIFGSLT